jgi:Astacin (Peptidase family M12A)
MLLPQELWIDAASTATGINPANAPAQGIMRLAAPDVVIEPDHLALLTAKYWGSGGVRLTVGFMDNPASDLRARLLAHMNAWGAWCNVQFVETATDPQVRISREAGFGYSSYVGTDVLLIAADQPTMRLSSFTMNTTDSEFFRVVRHETGHTLGFPHEHKRDEIVNRIDRAKAIAHFKQTQGWSEQKVIEQVLTPLANSALNASALTDIHSIMCYWLPASIMTDGVAVDGGTDIDAQDAQFAATMYPMPNPFPNWLELDDNPATVDIVASDGQLYQRHDSGRIWVYTGTPHTGWLELDDNPATVQIVADGTALYQRHNSGRIWVYTGTPHTGWLELDDNPATVDIVASGGQLYQRHDSGRIWVYTGTPHTGWLELDDNPATVDIVADGTALYQRHDSGRIWAYTGTPHTGWLELDDNPATVDIVASGGQLYQRHEKGLIWVYTGTPHTGWLELDANPATTQIVASGGQLYQRHANGRIWVYTGTPHTGWLELDNNPATVDIAAADGQLYQRHNSGRIWMYTG